ncbi:SAV_6107 family HEPN domain-containing protein [Amycolatopsis sp. A133]|uniref:SAV_6107 family HEPN domain-containing protein n=1 Tax=Amycolatopsis sp. A133 TaxID=3064472 RepID=UPI0027F22461|nr:SAV_6107 family HEPN domain-containing protein [Amycolatopsis sp. A133]MDQ7802394.1 SAV_6107 family HEPN domain-containing protein [Amycolatopsis sp. A133]
MSVKVVSPTDPGQPELPMSLRPQPAPAGTHRGRSRQCLTAGAEPRQRSSASGTDSRQPQLPISLCTSTPVAAEPPESRPAAAGADAPQSRPVVAGSLDLPIAADSSRPLPSVARAADTGSGESELPIPPRVSVPAQEQSRPAVADTGSGEPELPIPAQSSSSEPSPSPASAAEAGSALPMALRPPGADSAQSQLPMSLRPPASPAAAGLLGQARRGLAEAERESRPAERFIGAYLAALRGAAAVLAARGRPHRGRARPASTWVLLDSVAPELREWSAFFASNSAARAAAQAGITGKVTAESAEGLLRAATSFLELVRRLVHGLPITGEAHVA